ncbi:hypothetical protein G5B40_11605 [Pikeienuella piscinae]|uniref:Uncharacterized protein n=1 Tax=Pikeienuella piscinae TaxID=2748098 RepID=A0A7L5BX76_9RHOB|nr:contractile injection system tape measure protein [Pikeienuella piscinae]QIE56041.1 hypothetical protein G5B40_11605 [Pikeienuella piscinae]
MALDRPSDNTHRIGRARFDLSGDSHAALLTFRAGLAAAAEGPLPAALAAALDPLAGPEEVVEIVRLEIDLGDIDAAEVDVATIAAAVARAAADAVARARPAAPDPDSPPHETDGAPRRSDLHTAALSALLFHLRTGGLEERSPRRRVAELCALVAEAVRESHAPRTTAAFQAALATESRAGPAAMTRLIAAAPAAVVHAILAALFPRLTVEFGGDGALRAALEKAAGSTTAIRALARQFDALIADAASGAPDVDDEIGGPRRRPASAPAQKETPDMGVPIAVENAGVVLLHPFLPRLFALSGLTERTRFVTDDARAAAARLIHYLATGETQAEEPVLHLPRILCAIPQETPILPVEPLAPALIENADKLLHAALRHWTKLGRASPEGLRETFLIRAGVLAGPPRRQRLRVETRGVDVLLGSLPWGLDPIRLPWLEAPIGVDWA